MADLPSIKDIVKDNTVQFLRYRAAHFYYTVFIDGHGTFSFPVPSEEVGDAAMEREDKAILFMRYIRKAIAEGTFLRQ